MNIYLKKQIFRREVRKFVITGNKGNSNVFNNFKIYLVVIFKLKLKYPIKKLYFKD